MSSLVWDVAIYAYGAEGADAKFLGWTQAAGAWIENEEALYLFTVGADGTLQMFKNGHCIGTTKAKLMRSMARAISTSAATRSGRTTTSAARSATCTSGTAR